MKTLQNPRPYLRRTSPGSGWSRWSRAPPRSIERSVGLATQDTQRYEDTDRKLSQYSLQNEASTTDFSSSTRMLLHTDTRMMVCICVSCPINRPRISLALEIDRLHISGESDSAPIDEDMRCEGAHPRSIPSYQESGDHRCGCHGSNVSPPPRFRLALAARDDRRISGIDLCPSLPLRRLASACDHCIDHVPACAPEWVATGIRSAALALYLIAGI